MIKKEKEKNKPTISEEEKSFSVRDRRFWKAESSSDASESEALSATRQPTFVRELETQLKVKQAKIDELAAALRAQREEFRLVRERISREQESVILNQKTKLFEPLLEIADSLERCVQAIDNKKPDMQSTHQGINLILQQYQKSLDACGVKRLSLTGSRFNPDFAEAIATSDCTDETLDNQVLEEYRAGYTIEDKLIRPARVRVGRYVKLAREVKKEEANDATTKHS